MSLTEQQRQEQLDVIRRTGGNREVMLSQRVIPDSYVAYSKLVEREEQTLTLPGAAVPVRLIVSKALDRKPGCSLHVNFHGGGFILPQNGAGRRSVVRPDRRGHPRHRGGCGLCHQRQAPLPRSL